MQQQTTTPRLTGRRGLARQRQRREQEQQLRQHVVEWTAWSSAQGMSLHAIAGQLLLAPRTLRQWSHDQQQRHGRIIALGRRTIHSARDERMAVLEVLAELGPHTSVATLRECFPTMCRAELTDLLKRYRRYWRLRHQEHPCRLQWLCSGAVWAIDFAEPPQPIDGRYPYLLALRDLASGRQLLWLPVTDITAAAVCAALPWLFACYGAPLVLKADNGSPFIAGSTLEFLAQSRVLCLFSPPRTPSYNGSIEAGIGSLKTRTERHASAAGHPGYWTSDDVAAAQAEANATARPHGPRGPSPDELWQRRVTVSPETRAAFAASVQRQRDHVNQQEGIVDTDVLPLAKERRLQRQALRRALVEHGYLLVSRRQITLPIPRQKTANIS